MASITDKITDTRNAAIPASTRASGTRSIGGNTLACEDLSGWPTASKVHYVTYQIDADGEPIAGTQNDCAALVSGNNLTSIVILDGVDNGNAINDVVEMLPTSSWGQDLADALTNEHDRLGAHTDVTADSIVVTGNVTAANFIQSGGASANGWTTGLPTADTVTYNGNRSYDLVFNSTDITDDVSPGMRIRTTRTVAAPTQCADLEASSSQYFNKTSPAGTTFTDDFCVGAWIKLESYGTGIILSRWNGTSGWYFFVGAGGQLSLAGTNASASNSSVVTSYPAVPLNKWVYVSAQLDMSAFTATSTTSYIMIDGVNVPANVSRTGTNPTALVQAGNLEVGSYNGGLFPFDGKIAQVWYSSAKITQANMRTLCSQSITPALITTHSIVSAYSLDNSLTDLNTTSANNLTAQGGALATSADSPFGRQSDDTISSTLDYGVITSATFSTNTTLTVQVPEGCTIPTSGGVTAVAYSTQASPYRMPAVSNIIAEAIYTSHLTTTATSIAALTGGQLTCTLPANKRVKVSLTPGIAHGSGSAPQVLNVGIYDDTTRIAITSVLNTTAGNPNGGFTPVAKFYTGAGGAKTYNIYASNSNAGTLTYVATATSPLYFTVELEEPW